VTLAAVLFKSASTTGKTSEAPAKHHDELRSGIMVIISKSNTTMIGIHIIPGPTKPTVEQTEGLA